jgi:hypothetical protein
MLHTSSISISPEATMPAISCRFIAVILALTLAAAPAAAQIVCQVTAHVGCFTDYIQSRRCYPVGPIDVTSQVIATACPPPLHAVKPHPHVNRWSAPRTAPSCPTSTRPSSASPNSSFPCVALRASALCFHFRRAFTSDGCRFGGQCFCGTDFDSSAQCTRLPDQQVPLVIVMSHARLSSRHPLPSAPP